MSDDTSTEDSNLNEKIEIFSTEDEKIKSLGELLTNDSSRAILQWLLTNEMTAKQISEKIEISLPLAIYHLNKMQELGVVKISKVGKNVKERDMKYYTATKFAIIILPESVSKKAKESKMLLRSLKTIYRFAGIAIAGVAAWFGTISMQTRDSLPAYMTTDSSQESIREETPSGSAASPSGGNFGNVGEGEETGSYTLEESLELAQRKVEAANIESSSSSAYASGIIAPDLFWPIIITLAVVGIGLCLELFFRIYLHSKKKQKATF